MAVSQYELVSLSEAERLTGFDRRALRGAIADGRLPAQQGRRDSEPGRRGTRIHWLIRRADLAEFVSSVPACLRPGCERLAPSRSGYCCGPHANGARMQGKPLPPEVREKVLAARIGRVEPPRTPEWKQHISSGIQRFYDSDRSLTVRAERSARMQQGWETGGGAAEVCVQTTGRPRTRQVWLGRWHGREGADAGIEPGRVKGGRPAKMTPDQQVEILRLTGEGRSSREIAELVFGDRRFYLRVQRFLKR